ncbi:MAG TPA: dihydroneopterin aldolase [candidate division Zixibacteria bacterium]|nr:dihydroneopterin aldolase [candidate division Zixibacteria bacterium]
MDKIIIKDLLLRGIVGINEDERANKQDILINLVIYSDTRPAAASDDISDAVNYRTITKRIIAHVEQSSDFLVERLAEDIAQFILRDFGVEKVIVRVEKPGALRFARSVGVEIVRERSDYS